MSDQLQTTDHQLIEVALNHFAACMPEDAPENTPENIKKFKTILTERIEALHENQSYQHPEDIQHHHSRVQLTVHNGEAEGLLAYAIEKSGVVAKFDQQDCIAIDFHNNLVSRHLDGAEHNPPLFAAQTIAARQHAGAHSARIANEPKTALIRE